MTKANFFILADKNIRMFGAHSAYHLLILLHGPGKTLRERESVVFAAKGEGN